MNRKIFIITILLSIFSIKNSLGMQITGEEENQIKETKTSQPENLKIKMKKKKNQVLLLECIYKK